MTLACASSEYANISSTSSLASSSLIVCRMSLSSTPSNDPDADVADVAVVASLVVGLPVGCVI